MDYKSLAALFPEDSAYSKNFGWAVIVGVVLLGFGKEPMVKGLAEAILAQTGDDHNVQLAAFRKLREALLKASPLVGFPRSINGLAILRTFLESSTPNVAKRLESDKSLRQSVPHSARQCRGKDFFSKIYGQHTERVLDSLNISSGGDLGEFAINCIYGDLMSETSILDEKETGMLEFACCLTLMTGPQAKGHMYGARNLGNSGEEIRAVTALVERMAKQLDMPWSIGDMDFLAKAEKW